MGKLTGYVVPSFFTKPLGPLTPETTLGYAAIEWAKQHWPEALLPHTCWALIHGLELWPEDGSLRFWNLILEAARRNQKTTYSNVCAGYRMQEDPTCRLVLGTSVLLGSSRETFLGFAATVEEIGGWHKERQSAGQEEVRAINGSRYVIKSATRKAVRGMGVDLAILDELREWKNKEGEVGWAAISPSINGRPKGQRLLLSNAGDDESRLLKMLRDVAISGTDLRTGLFSWSARHCDRLDCRTCWRQANPALGHTLSEEQMVSDLKTHEPNTFRVEYLCQWVNREDSLVAPADWEACADPAGSLDSLRGRVHAALDVSADGSRATLAVAGRTDDGRIRVEIAGSFDSVQAARAELPDLISRIRPRSLRYALGPTTSNLGDVIKKIRVASPVAAGELAEAAGALVEAVEARRLLHAGNLLLTSQILAVDKLPSGQGGGYCFERRGGNADAAVAASLSHWAARAAPAPKATKLITSAH
jgi:Phage Terminase